MKKEEIISLLKSGDFTIIGEDCGEVSLYKGKYTYDEAPLEPLENFTDWNDNEGYISEIVSLLVESLGGSTDSI